jgi:hypothetical protein
MGGPVDNPAHAFRQDPGYRRSDLVVYPNLEIKEDFRESISRDS